MKKINLIILLILFPIISFSQSFFVDKGENEIIINKTYITIGYSINYLIPNYVGEKLTHDMIVGPNKREPGFYPDLELPKEYQTKSGQYTKSGYDRGHLAPAADFKFSKEGMYDSFSMANVAPQWPTLNRQKWQYLEDRLRKLTLKVDTLYIITGTIVNNPKKTIKGNIVIPSYFYKAIWGKKNKKTVISCAWIYNNDGSLNSREMSINDLEKIINRNLFYGMNCENCESKIILAP